MAPDFGLRVCGSGFGVFYCLSYGQILIDQSV